MDKDYNVETQIERRVENKSAVYVFEECITERENVEGRRDKDCLAFTCDLLHSFSSPI